MRHMARRSLALLAIVAAALAGSCGGAHFQAHGAPTELSQRDVIGDYDDVDAAIDLACSASELAILQKTNEEGVKRFEMITVGDEPAWAQARAIAGDRVEVRVRIRDAGDAAWEARFLDAVQKRLAQLHGRTSAPIRGFAPFDSK